MVGSNKTFSVSHSEGRSPLQQILSAASFARRTPPVIPEERVLKVLIVDSDEISRAIVAHSLRMAEFPVSLVETCNCAEAIAALQKTPFDSVFLDYALPDGNGLSLIRKLRGTGISIPLLVLTSQDDEQVAAELMKAGASDYLAKARLSPTILLRMLRNAVRVYQAEASAALADQRLRESEERYRLVLEGTSDGLWDWDLGRNTIYWNERLYEITGLAPNAFGGTFEAFYNLVHPGDRQRYIDALNRYLSGRTDADAGEGYRVELRLRHASDGYRYCIIRARAQRDAHGRPFRMAGVVRDITERREFEERLAAQNELLARQNQELERQRQQIARQHSALQAAYRLKSQFLATISHELRTPMNAIIGFSQLLLRQRHGELQPRQADMVERILNNGKHMLALVTDLLDFSRIEAGRLKLRLEALDWVELVRSTVAEMQSLADRKGLSLEVVTDAESLPGIGDRGRVRQVLVNLLSNALKFTDRGGVTVAVRASGDRVELSVRDTGSGIAQADLSYIFEAFRQVDQSTSRPHQGTGLGLAIVKALVRLMDGDIAVDSQLGSGTAFRVTLPRAIDPSPRDPEPGEPEPGEPEPGETGPGSGEPMPARHDSPEGRRARLASPQVSSPKTLPSPLPLCPGNLSLKREDRQPAEPLE